MYDLIECQNSYNIYYVTDRWDMVKPEKAKPIRRVRSFIPSGVGFGAPLRTKLRTHISLKSRHKFNLLNRAETTMPKAALQRTALAMLIGGLRNPAAGPRHASSMLARVETIAIRKDHFNPIQKRLDNALSDKVYRQSDTAV